MALNSIEFHVPNYIEYHGILSNAIKWNWIWCISGSQVPATKTKNESIWEHLRAIAPSMTPFLWTLQAIHLCLPAGCSFDHYERGRSRSLFPKMFRAHNNLSQVQWNWPNSKLSWWGSGLGWKRWHWYKGQIYQYTKASQWSFGHEVFHRKLPSQRTPSRTHKPSQ